MEPSTMNMSNTMQWINLGLLVLGLGATYGKMTSALKSMKEWVVKHEAENTNAFDRLDKKIEKLDTRLDIRTSTVENKLITDDGSSRYVRHEDCERHRAETAKHQEAHYETMKTLLVEYHDKSHQERKDLFKEITAITRQMAVIATRLKMEEEN